ncbi:glycosyl transferase family 39 [Methanolacinia petrolearia DSM 11571]|uniref:Glycosyl transferase family 39 n=1 Tax=Methanolacinia petrolearia (strain DSM 11571 / OCM 486 / SEBR 4847) TaxID=679926 RepID=E1RKI0_METP4|nr:glycosyltransferase family 39 protein [Methanolacinia petrolearia]ADN35833.1 glycosyl transferase family 39 [Methanolacinia petrolearia DSM 11571]
MTGKDFISAYRNEILLAAILVLSGILNIWNIWSQGITNEYYAAAVRSMLENPGVMFFNSFDAAGFVTVDKPPVGLWVQAASAALLGFSGWALVLPQALAGVGSVALVYLIVSRPFGKQAGLVSAFALAVTPIFVAVSRNGTIDGLLILVLLLAFWTGLYAARKQSLPYLLLAMILVGIGFNIKMIQALIVVPAILAAYILATMDKPAIKRVSHIFLAVVVLLVVSFSWTVAMDSIPADERPYIGGSGDNTVWGLITGHNGIDRLESSSGSGTGSAPSLQGEAAISDTISEITSSSGALTSDNSEQSDLSNHTSGNRSSHSSGLLNQSKTSSTRSSSAGSSGGSTHTGSGSMDDTGSPGIFRLFGSELSGQIAWLLAFALIGLLAFFKRPAEISGKGLEESGYFSERGILLAALLLWLLPGMLYFSFTTGHWHVYYLATIAPPLAALAGIGAFGLYRAFFTDGPKSWLLVAAIAIAGLLQAVFLLYNEEWVGAFIPAFIAAIVLLTASLVYINIRKSKSGHLQKAVVFTAIAILFVAPFAWACTPMLSGSGSRLPTAGPDLLDGGKNSAGSGESLSGLAQYLISHNNSETFLVAVPSSNSGGAELILETGYPVMALGGYSGSDQILSVEELEEYVDEGRIKYFLVTDSSSGRGSSSGNSEIYSWIRDYCTEVPSSEWSGSTGEWSSYTLYEYNNSAQ